MQTLIFVSAHAGISKKGHEYSMVRLSNGINSFTVTKSPEVDVKGYVEGDRIDCEFEIGPSRFGEGIEATLTGIKEN